MAGAAPRGGARAFVTGSRRGGRGRVWPPGASAYTAVTCAALLVVAGSGTVFGQTPQPRSGTLAGVVVDAVTGEPVVGVVVTLEPAGGGLLVERRAGGLVAATRSVVTTPRGAYRFADLPAGRYRLRLERLGYRGATVEVDLRRPVDATVSIGLELEPVALEPVGVAPRSASLFQRAANTPAELDEARRGSERARQDLFLSPDARVVTLADVMDGVTLGEGDIFRALQRFPGVATRDDYTAEIWTRGAPWTHTRVTFDGVPLFNPLHAVGILSAIPPEALGAVFFHPGVRPASLPEGSAGAVDLRSRPGGGDGSVRGVADLSLATAKLALDQDVAGRGSWVVAGRRSHLGLLSGGLSRVGLDTLDLPYRFHDLTGRVDLELTGRTRLEASGLWEEDRLHGDVEGVVERTRARWGNAVGRATLRTELGGLGLGQTVGGSRFLARTDEHLVRTREPAQAWTEPASWNEIRHLQLAGEVTPAPRSGARRAGSAATSAHSGSSGASSGGPSRTDSSDSARAGPPSGGAPVWSLGYDIAFSDHRYDGPVPRFHAVRPDTTGQIRHQGALAVAGLWGETRLRVNDRLVLGPGGRVEAGEAPANGAPVRVSPRVAARWAVSPDASFSVAAGRSWQYIQAIGLAGPSIHPAFHASHFWVLASERSPAVRSDIVSLGGERWLGSGWLVSATVFARRATGVTVPDPRPGRLRGRPLFVEAENTARGVDTAFRRIGAGWSASLGYAYGVSELEAAGWRYPSPADRRHTLDAMAGVRLTRSLRLAGAFTAMSGSPFTRAYTRSPQDCNTFGFGCDDPEGSWVEEPNAERTPPYQSLDASLQWSRAVGRLDLSAYAQVRNVLGRENAVTYAGTVPIGRTGRDAGSRVLWDDRFEAGLPRLPLLGLRVTF